MRGVAGTYLVFDMQTICAGDHAEHRVTVSRPFSQLREHCAKGPDCSDRVPRENAIPQSRKLLRMGQPETWVGDPARSKAHQPLHELGRWARRARLAQDRGRWCGPFGDAFPSSDGDGVASPAAKKSSISANVASGEGCRRLSTWSITWWLSAIVPRRALTWANVSPPLAESDARGVRNSAMGENEDAEPGMRCADCGSG